MKPGTEVKIIKGDHRGKKGKVGSNRPSNALQKGKVPIVVGNRNQVIWTRPEWVSENFLAHEGESNSQSPIPSPQSPIPHFQLADVEKRILGYLMTRKVPVLDVEIAIALDLPLSQYLPALKHLEQEGLVFKNDEDGYQMVDFSAGYYVSDGERTGLISSESKGVFTIAFADGNELQCTIEDLREGFTVCGKQLELLLSEPQKEDLAILEYLKTGQRKTISEIAIAFDSTLYKIRQPLDRLVSLDYVHREGHFYQCNQLGQSVCLKASAGSQEQPTSSVDLNGSNPSKLTTTPLESSKTISITTSTTETSENITPDQEQPTSTQSDFPATTPVTQATEPDFTANSQDSGSKDSVALLRGYLNSSLSNSQRESFIAACEQSLGDCEWQATLGTIRSSYKQRKLELASTAPGFLSLPTLTASSGKTSRPAGSTKCDRTARKLGLILDSQSLSIEMMAAISGFPPEWTACLSESKNANNGEDFKADSSTDEQSSPNKYLSPSDESNISIPSPSLMPGKQWVKPNWITLKNGTQSRDVDEIYQVNISVVQNYAEMMEQGLWEWEREPLPVAFLSADGKIYAGDCHHRVSAAVASGKEIYVNLLPGELVDAILYSCQANTYHGLLLRPKDQRKRIELFLDTLAGLDEVRSQSLLRSIPNLTEIERKNGKWSTRVIAKYLRLTESGYRTIINILQERELSEKFTQFSQGDCVLIKPDSDNLVGVAEGITGKIRSFDKRKGIFVIPADGSLGADGRMLPSLYVHPDYLEKTDAPVETVSSGLDKQPSPLASVHDEIKQKAKEVGIPVNGLPDVEHDQGSPDTLVDDRPFASPGLINGFVDVESLINKSDQLPDKEINRIWDAIAPRIHTVDLVMAIDLQKLTSDDLEDLICVAQKELNSREKSAD